MTESQLMPINSLALLIQCDILHYDKLWVWTIPHEKKVSV